MFLDLTIFKVTRKKLQFKASSHSFWSFWKIFNLTAPHTRGQSIASTCVSHIKHLFCFVCCFFFFNKWYKTVAVTDFTFTWQCGTDTHTTLLTSELTWEVLRLWHAAQLEKFSFSNAVHRFQKRHMCYLSDQTTALCSFRVKIKARDCGWEMDELRFASPPLIVTFFG